MKNLKKLSGILLAIAVLLACTVSAFAAETSGTSATTRGKITITNAIKDETYNLYKMLELESFNSATGAYTYKLVGSDWDDFFTNGGYGSTLFTVSSDSNRYVTLNSPISDDSTQAETLAKEALAYAKTKGLAPTKTETAGSNGTLEFSDLDLGYYVVDSTLGTLCDLTTTNNEASIIEKNDLPTIDKYILDPGEVEENKAHVGETIDYKIVVHAKKGAAGYKIVDTCDAGITLSATAPVVKVGDVVVPDTNYTWDRTDGQNFTLEFNQTYLDTITGNTDIVITYSATLNKVAKTVSEEANGNQNKAKLMYNDTGAHETVLEVTKTYTYKFDLVKTTNANKLLDGATFELYTTATDGTAIELIKVSDNVYRIPDVGETPTVTSIEVKGGKVEIRGLEPNTYWVAETVAPKGYNKLLDREDITIADADETATVSGDEWTNGGLKVVNETGTLLPSTGGIGTTIFYIVGGVLVAAAVVLLVAKKRTSENR